MIQQKLFLGSGIAVLAVAFVGAFLLTTTHTVSWYVAHPAEMQAAVAWCNDNPGRQRANCSAAAEALWKVSLDAFSKRLNGK